VQATEYSVFWVLNVTFFSVDNAEFDGQLQTGLGGFHGAKHRISLHLLHKAGLLVVATVWLLAVFGRNTNVREVHGIVSMPGNRGGIRSIVRRVNTKSKMEPDTNIREVDRVVRKPENREGAQVHKGIHTLLKSNDFQGKYEVSTK
ncbi:hypothetical protein BU15DRAFT_69652, partial [Melanogaster broomeanus]